MTAIPNKTGVRVLNEEDLRQISEATAKGCKFAEHDGHKQRAAVEAGSRVTEKTLRRYENQGEELTTIVPLDVAAEIDLMGGYPFLLEAFADLVGWKIFKPLIVPMGNLLPMLRVSVKESAELHETIIEATEDQKLDLDELYAIRKEALDVAQTGQAIADFAEKQIAQRKGGQCDGC